MKITKKMVDYYNNNKGIFSMPSFNEAYNKAHGIPSRDEWAVIHRVYNENFGMSKGKVTMNMIKESEGE